MGIRKLPALCAFSNVSSWYHNEKYFTRIPTKNLEIPNSTIAIDFSNVYTMEKKNCPVLVATITLPTVMAGTISYLLEHYLEKDFVHNTWKIASEFALMD